MSSTAIKVVAVITLALLSCTHNSAKKIHVKSFGERADAKRSIQFYEAKVKGENFEKYSDRKKTIGKCTLEAQRHGVTVKPAAEKCPDCYMVFISVGLAERTQKNHVPITTTPTTTSCTSSYGDVNCTTYGGHVYGGYSYDSKYWQKVGIFSVKRYDAASKSVEDEREVQTYYDDTDDGLTDLTAEYLCRGFFDGYKVDVVQDFVLANRVDDIPAGNGGGVAMKSAPKQQCWDATDQGFWAVPSEWCLEKDGRKCLYERDRRDPVGKNCVPK